jgi:hypothetical protein
MLILRDVKQCDPQPGERDAYERANDDLKRHMADEFPQLLIIDWLSLKELANDLIEYNSLAAGRSAHGM